MDIATIYFVLVPIIISLILFCLPEKIKTVSRSLFVAITVFNFIAVCAIFGKIIFSSVPWDAFGFEYSISIKIYEEILLLIIASFALLSSIFAVGDLKDNPKAKLFNASMILALAFANGAIITNNLIFMLVFIEALAIPFVMMILASANDNKKLAVKAFAITAVADLFLMLGIGIAFALSDSMSIFDISLKLSSGLEVAAFVCFVIGAAGKLGVMPFHSWMPEAAEKTSVPFLAFMTTAVEKVLGVYILLVAMNMFNVKPGAPATLVLIAVVIIGALLAALLSNNQKSFKKMLMYTSISQGSFIMAAILTAFPVAMAGAVLHLIAHTVYKSALFYASSITDKVKSSYLSIKQNLHIFVAFALAVASFIGIPFFAAFYSKEFIYEGAYAGGEYILLVGFILITFFCSSAVLNWFGKIFLNSQKESFVKDESNLFITLPLIISGFLSLFLGIFNNMSLQVVKSFLPIAHASHTNIILLFISLAMLLLALLNFIIGFFSKAQNGLGFVKNILSFLKINKLDESVAADPYSVALKVYGTFAAASFDFDKAVNKVYDVVITQSVVKSSDFIKKIHNGDLSRYILWALLGIAALVLLFI